MHGIQALTMIPDPRRRRSRHSPRISLLAIVLRAVMHPPTPSASALKCRVFVLPHSEAAALRMAVHGPCHDVLTRVLGSPA
jgi:hypothetical protein